MNFINGIIYNLRGLRLGVKTPRLLFWGLIRFGLIIVLTILAASLILAYHQTILNLIWTRPESAWIIWLWSLISWILSLVLVGISAVISFLLSQILFSVLIMDHMSRLTELKITGVIKEPGRTSLPRLFVHLIRQEIPRAVIPLMVSLLCMLGGFTPAGPVLAVLSCAIAAIFLAWDNTDLLPARQLMAFRSRFRFLSSNILFHLGFGLPFLVPGFNILFLAFAPVGATLFHLEKKSPDS